MFGRNSSTTISPGDTVVEEPVATVDETPAEVRADENAEVEADNTQRIMTSPRRDAVVDEPVAPAVVEKPVEVPVEPKRRWAHVSFVATLCFFVGTVAVAATLTGLLAPFGFALGVLAVLFGIVATFPINRSGVTGHSLVGLGVFFGLVAIVLSVLAMGGDLNWLSSKTNEITVVHNWLGVHMSWVNHWS
jgi:hypothetical protein